MVSLLVEIPHSDLSKVTRMVLVHVRSVVVDHSKTSATGMLAVLAYTTVSGRAMVTTVRELVCHLLFFNRCGPASVPSQCDTVRLEQERMSIMVYVS